MSTNSSIRVSMSLHEFEKEKENAYFRGLRHGRLQVEDEMSNKVLKPAIEQEAVDA